MGVRKVAVTGGIACGKTTVCQFFRNLGAQVVSADHIAHQLLENDPQVQAEVLDLLGPSILKDGHLARELIAAKVFQEPALLKALERVLHPKVYLKIEEAYALCTSQLFIADIPLLFETGGEKYFDSTVVVLCEETIAKKRNPQFNERAKFQMPIEQKAKLGTYLIENNSTLEHLEESVKQIYQHLQGEK